MAINSFRSKFINKFACICGCTSLLFTSVIHSATFSVSTDAQLEDAIDDANRGDVIELAPGNYADLKIKSRNPSGSSGFLTITSADKNNLAKLGDIEIESSTFIKFDTIESQGSGSQVIYIHNGSTDIQILNSDIHGELIDRNNPDGNDINAGFGIRVRNGVLRVRIENNYIHDVQDAVAMFSGSYSTLKGNKCDWVRSDCFKFSGVTNILFENNFGARNVARLEDSHVDFVQGQGSVKNSIFRGNVAIMGSTSFQGLFFGGSDENDIHENNLIENNIIYNDHGNGIYFNDRSFGNVVRYNTVLVTPSSKSYTVRVDGDIKENNIIISRQSLTRIDSNNNHYIQHVSTSEPLHYNTYYKDLAKDASLVTIEDFEPVPDSPAVNRAGAFARIYELLGAGGGVEPEPEPDPTPSVVNPLIVPVLNLILDK